MHLLGTILLSIERVFNTISICLQWQLYFLLFPGERVTESWPWRYNILDISQSDIAWYWTWMSYGKPFFSSLGKSYEIASSLHRKIVTAKSLLEVLKTNLWHGWVIICHCFVWMWLHHFFYTRESVWYYVKIILWWLWLKCVHTQSY